MRHLPGRAAAALAGLAGLGGLLVVDQQPVSRGLTHLMLIVAMFAVFVGAARAVTRLPEPVALRIAVAGGCALQLLALRVRPWTTDDYLRYVWDGRVQAAGTDPYRYRPGDPRLASLRDGWLFPDGVHPRLNHPLARTIYPPVAQAWFWLVQVLSGGYGSGLQLQIGSALLAIAVSFVLVVVLRRTGGDVRRVVWWAWCPAVTLEAGGNAHVDVLASLLVVAALGLVSAGRWTGGGVLLGLAVATKFIPAVVAVAVPPRRSLRVGAAAATAVAMVYLPHVLALGAGVTGFLGGYLDEESHDRFDLVRFLLPDALATPVALLLLAGAALAIWAGAGRREAAGEPLEPWHGAATMVGVWLLVITPAYPWYALLLVALVALGARTIWLVVPLAVYPVYAAADLGHQYYLTRVVCYGLAAVVLGVFALRARRAGVERSTTTGDAAIVAPVAAPEAPAAGQR